MNAAAKTTATGVLALLLVPAVSTLQWVNVADVGSFSIRLPYLAILIAIVACLSKTGVRAVVRFTVANKGWLVPYAVYLVLLAVALRGSDGAGIPIRQMFFVVGTIAFGSLITRSEEPAGILRLGAFASIATLVVLVEVLARRVGLSWIDAIGKFLYSGNLDFVTYSFFRRVFGLVAANPSETIAAAEKNAVAVSVFVSGLCIAATTTKKRSRVLGGAILIVVAIILVLTNTRSVILVAGASASLAAGMHFLRQSPAGARRSLILATSGLFFFLAIALAQTGGDAFTEMMGERFSFADASAHARLDQVTFAFSRIASHPWAGSGFAEVGGNPVHNLLLGSWMHAGIVAAGLVFVFYAVVLGKWLGFIVTVVRRPGYWVLPLSVEWVAALPLILLVRVWLSGDAGHPFMGEWIALGAFFALLHANETQSGKLGARSESAPGFQFGGASQPRPSGAT